MVLSIYVWTKGTEVLSLVRSWAAVNTTVYFLTWSKCMNGSNMVKNRAVGPWCERLTDRTNMLLAEFAAITYSFPCVRAYVRTCTLYAVHVLHRTRARARMLHWWRNEGARMRMRTKQAAAEGSFFLKRQQLRFWSDLDGSHTGQKQDHFWRKVSGGRLPMVGEQKCRSGNSWIFQR